MEAYARPCHLSWRGFPMAKNEKTGPKAAKAASDVLRDDRTGSKSKTAAGSALSQAPDKGKKGKK